MTNPHLARIEAQLERLIEGAFAQLFRNRVSAQDLLLHVTRAFEEHAQVSSEPDPRKTAPDRYTIRLHPETWSRLSSHEQFLSALLSEHVGELATSLDYRLLRVPVVDFRADEQLSMSDVVVEAAHDRRTRTETAALKRVDLKPQESRSVHNAQLIINGEETISLVNDIVNIGRSRDNEIVLQDPYISRHHAQLRLRFGAYTLFDNDSQHGTYVNDVRIREHRLQPGDVITMGKSRMLYVEDNDGDVHTQTAIHPISGL